MSIQEEQKPKQEMQTSPETPEQAAARVAGAAQEGKEHTAAGTLAGAEGTDEARESQQAKIDAIVADLDKLVSAGKFDLRQGVYLNDRHPDPEVARVLATAHEVVGWSLDAVMEIEGKLESLQQERKEGKAIDSFANKIADRLFNGSSEGRNWYRLENSVKSRDLAGVVSVLKDWKVIGPKEIEELAVLNKTNAEHLFVLADQYLAELERKADNATY